MDKLEPVKTRFYPAKSRIPVPKRQIASKTIKKIPDSPGLTGAAALIRHSSPSNQELGNHKPLFAQHYDMTDIIFKQTSGEKRRGSGKLRQLDHSAGLTSFQNTKTAKDGHSYILPKKTFADWLKANLSFGKSFAAAAIIFSVVLMPWQLTMKPLRASSIAFVNGYPTINGNYVDCNGNIDNDPSHHTLDPLDADPGHHVGQNCPSQSLVGKAANQSSPNAPAPAKAAKLASQTVSGHCPSPATNAFTACYYSDRNLSNLVLSRTDQAINFDWSGGSPAAQVPVDNFSARWEGNFNFNAGNYTFTVTADDGIRVYVDNNPIINQWLDQPPATYTATVNLSAGSHLIKVEYYENGGGAVAKLSWNQSGSTGGISSAIPAQLTSSSGNPFSGIRLYADPNSNAKRQAEAWRNSRPQDAMTMDKIASQPSSVWLGGWNGDIKTDVNNLVSAAAGQGAVPVMIAYNIPNRDCGGYSAGGAQTVEAYKSWINSLAAGIGNRKAVVVLEPDAVTLTSCLSAVELQNRYDMMNYAVSALKSLGQTAVYIDSGHAKWLGADELAAKLKNAGIAGADGFALNTSNFVTTQDNLAYGQAVSSNLGGKHFIIDTSRNGNGPTPDMQWCNPAGRALGSKPTASTGNALADAFYWGKQPGESDGNCNGGPSAGVFWPEYALGLAQRASW